MWYWNQQPVVKNIQVSGSSMAGETARLTTQATGKVQAILFKEGQWR
ncbi:MAG: hypothetical protein U5L96_11195 [Owenweeksia sp.]|nr:hypothetical protein [Owenweeksia sp.]